ncbi:hypothetical protein [Streptomyces sp. SID9913]|uniref:hypothetical protein n=1 Tax=Streptomyces sp. SID9913 TaxID=2706117 RepID=UPI001EF26DAB|nr:hypothetical protein [Streptomyces sp. SID9913]
MFAGLLSGPVAIAAQLDLLTTKKPDPVSTKKIGKRAAPKKDQAARHPWKKPKITWPKAAVVTSALPGPGTAVKAGKLPVRLERPAGKKSGAAESHGSQKVQVQVLDRATTESLGVAGIALALRPVSATKSSVDVEIDYSGFRNAYGGDWASRLTLRTLPTCALTSPGKKKCATGVELPTDNDTDTHSLTAAVSLPAAAPSDTSEGARPVVPAGAKYSVAANTVLLAATAQEAGPSGDFGATSLAPSASWAAGGSSGAFSWTYPIDTPDIAGNLVPELKLGYSSQSVDGRTAATNNQANGIGDGWSMEPGYIERQYVSCSDDKKGSNTTAEVGDLCWKKDNAVINLGGQSNILIKDSTSGEWHLENDDGTKVEKLSSTARANGDNDGEYWRVTTPDGTRYFFGYNRPAGWATGKEETNSTWTVPVYGNQTGEPCHATAFKDSWCQQA